MSSIEYHHEVIGKIDGTNCYVTYLKNEECYFIGIDSYRSIESMPLALFIIYCKWRYTNGKQT